MKRVLLALLILSCLVSAPHAQDLPSASEIISNLDAAYSKTNDYTCLADAHYKKGDRREDKVYKIFFKRPEMVRAEILEGDGGTVAVLTPDGKVRGHRGWPLQWLVLTVGLDDPLVTTIRGHTLKQSHFGYMIERMKEAITSEAVSVTGIQVIDGSETYVLETTYKTPRDGITRDLVFVDPSAWLIKKIRSFEGNVEVIKVVYSDIVMNSGLPDKLFEM